MDSENPSQLRELKDLCVQIAKNVDKAIEELKALASSAGEVNAEQ